MPIDGPRTTKRSYRLTGPHGEAVIAVVEILQPAGELMIEIGGREASLPLTAEEVDAALNEAPWWTVSVFDPDNTYAIVNATGSTVSWQPDHPAGPGLADKVLAVLDGNRVEIPSLEAPPLTGGVERITSAVDTGPALLEPITVDELRGLEALTRLLHQHGSGTGLSDAEEELILLLARLIEDQRRAATLGTTPRFGLVGVVKAAIEFSKKDLPTTVVLWSQAAPILESIGWPSLASLAQAAT